MTWRDLIRGGWVRLSRAGDKCGAHWRHEASGWELRHCGHPTANWPWLVYGPDGQTYTALNGRGFRTLADAAQGAASLSREARPPAEARSPAWIAVAHLDLSTMRVLHGPQEAK